MKTEIYRGFSGSVRGALARVAVLGAVAMGMLSVANGQVVTNVLTENNAGFYGKAEYYVAGSGMKTNALTAGDSAPIVATPSSNAYIFTGWSGTAAANIDDTNQPSANLTFVSNGVARANFTVGQKLTVSTVPASGVTVWINGVPYLNGSVLYLLQGTTNDILATGPGGDDFAEWQGNSTLVNGTLINANLLVIGPGAKTLGAHFVPHVVVDNVQVTLQSQSNGTAMLSYGTNSYVAPSNKVITIVRGSPIMLSAAASNGYAFTGWTDENGTLLTDVRQQAAPQPLTMSVTRTFRATFAQIFTVAHHEPNGPGSLDLVPPQSITNGISATVQAPTSSVLNGSTRYPCLGYTNFGPTPPPPVPVNATTFQIPNPTSNYQVTWRWGAEYQINIICPAGGTVSYNGFDGMGSGLAGVVGSGSNVLIWVGSNTTLYLAASPATGYSFASWTSGTNIFITPTLSHKILAAATYAAAFVQTDIRFNWYQSFGLNPNASDERGQRGDPDNDKISNEAEYQIYLSLTNDVVRAEKVNPLNCDSDNDGMDDYYEYFHIGSTNGTSKVGNQKNGLAMTTADSVNGPLGNPDGDFHWNTTTGYQTTQPLNNMEEYTGPDGVKPFTFETVPAGGTASDGWVNPVVGQFVVRCITNLTDTADQSFSDTPFTGDDKMDDGFKWSWDLWQTNNAGMLIINSTNQWTAISNTVPSWSESRIFKPSTTFVEPGGGAPSYDVWYNPVQQGLVPAGARRSWMTVMDKYHASSMVSSNVFPVIRGNRPDGNPAWCVNPFLWDTDGDGLPDGWELTFGYDPWTKYSVGIKGADDGHDNPLGKWYAQDAAGNRHVMVYLIHPYNPGTGYGYATPLEAGGPNTVQFINLEAIRGDGDGPYFPGVYENDRPISPNTLDSDGDGIWDGWEFYVGLNPQDQTDASLDQELPPPGDGLTNFEEFQSFATSTNAKDARTFVTGWLNKLKPTDPNDKDTDRDQITDGGEKAAFNYAASSNAAANIKVDPFTGESTIVVMEGSGLNPTSADTDGDHLPDAWENYFAGHAGVVSEQVTTTNLVTGTNGVVTTNIVVTTFQTNGWVVGMNGTMVDDKADYDGDGLLNYQEYMCGAVYCWQYIYNNGDTAWVRTNATYEPYDFFDSTKSAGGQWDVGTGGRAPYDWDPNFKVGMRKVPWTFMTASEGIMPFVLYWATSDPSSSDTDMDGMDDYWEVYHGLDPLYGNIDLVGGKQFGAPLMVNSVGSSDILAKPWIAGYGLMDPDQDGLPNINESLQPSSDIPPYYHTDPSPAWITDFSYSNSWVNLYYWLGRNLGTPGSRWWWFSEDVISGGFSPPTYMFSFESNEGYDTDNDNISDSTELFGSTNITTGVTDPLNSASPVKRRALYLNGINAAARTRDPHFVMPGELRTFTVEIWVRPENPASGKMQVAIERSCFVPQGNILQTPISQRRNFRIGLDPNGCPFAAYDGAGQELVNVEAKALSAYALRPNEWAHLTCTYGGRFIRPGAFIGQLSLYKNGILVASAQSSVIPANGFFDDPERTAMILWLREPIVVGAADDNPEGWVDGSAVLQGARSGSTHTRPALTNFFQGWVDQVAIWDGVRSQEQILGDMVTKMTRAQVTEAVTKSLTLPLLKAYFTFDNRPDPVRNPVSPVGFRALAYPNGRPSDYVSVPWWGRAPDRSRVYDDYTYLPWIENLVMHTPTDQPRDSMGVVTNGAFFPNTANPYGLVYQTAEEAMLEWHPQGGDRLVSNMATMMEMSNPTVADLLPLGYARTDENVPMWDGGGAPSVDPYDSDGDGLPDAWEEQYGLDPLSGVGDDGGAGDPDGDGLSNLVEYHIRTNPYNRDSNGNSVADGDEDSDGDGISNLEEINVYGTLAWDPDTDDDGIGDGDEVDRDVEKPDGSLVTSPVDSRSPLMPKSMLANGVALVVPARGKFGDPDRFSLLNWTVEGWVKAQSSSETGAVLLRKMDDGRTNFALRLENDYPQVEFSTVGGVSYKARASSPIPSNTWTHLAGSFSSATRILSLFVNGIMVTNRVAIDACATGVGETTMGGGIHGAIDDVSIWSVAREATDILAWYDKTFRAATSTASVAVIKDTITVTDNSNTTANVLLNAFLAVPAPSGVKNLTATLNGANSSAGVFEGFPVLPNSMPRPAKGVIMSSGNVKDAELLSNTSAGKTTSFGTPGDSNLTALAEGVQTYDAVTLTLTFQSDSSVKGVSFDFIFGSEEFPEFVGSQFNDDFGVFLDGENIAFDQAGKPISVNNNFFELNNDIWNTGNPATVGKQQVSLPFEYDGLTPLLTTSKALKPGIHTLKFAIADTGDSVLDSLVFMSKLRFTLETEGTSQSQTTASLSDLRAQYLFDDGQNTTITNPLTGVVTGHGAEDFTHVLDWNFALTGCVFNAGDAAPVTERKNDTDADGLPEWWENFYFGGDTQPDADPDGDGLNNLYEYWSGTDPLNAYSSGQGISDADADADGDGLSNGQEQQLGSRPDLTDTDDDGIPDGVEAGSPYMSPTDALSPIVDRVLQVSGGGYVEMPNDLRFGAESWTVEAWVNPTNLTAATVIGRQVEPNVWNYNLSLNANGQAITMFTPGDRTANVAVTSSVSVATGVWTHLAGSFNASNGYLSVYVNGTVRGYLHTGKRTAVSGVGPRLTRAGQGLKGWMDEVAIYATSLSDVMLQNTMAGVMTVSNAVSSCYYRFDDGTSATNDGAGTWVGTSGNQAWRRGQVQEFGSGIALNDWNTGWQQAGTLVGSVVMVAAPSNAPVLYAVMDSDNDGLPDWWEQANGLNVSVPTGDNGAYGDPDGDGLNNLAEFKAGTNPHRADTYSYGAPDFYLWAVTNKTIFGERFTDHDFMDDAWEYSHFVQNLLDPQRYDAQLDADGDGWSNYAEFMAGTSPTAIASRPMPTISGTLYYDGMKASSNVVIHAYQNPDMAGNPFIGTSIGLGGNNWAFILAADQAVFVESATIGTQPMDHGNLANGNIVPGSLMIMTWSTATNGFYARDDGNGHIGISGTIDYLTGAWNYFASGTTIILGSKITASYSYRPIIGLREGPLYLRAFKDINGNGSFDMGEPSGIAAGQPFNLEWTALGGIEIPLTDNALGYGRFSWPPIDSSLSNRVQISSGSLASPLTRWISPTRSFMDEQDFIQLGITNGLPSGTYIWTLHQQSLNGSFTQITNGTFNFVYPALTVPTLAAPVGGELRQYTRNTFKFAADGNSTVGLRLRVYSGTNAVGTPVYDTTSRLPYQHADGYRYLTPTNLYFGGATNLGNGPYTWTLVGLNGDGASAATGATFTVNTTAVDIETGPFDLGGTLRYFGKVSNTSGSFVVEASQSSAFGGLPDGQLVLQNTATTNKWPTNSFPFLMSGLPAGAYYVRAYLDQNGNRQLDATDTRGYLTGVTSFYSLATVQVNDLTPGKKREHTSLNIRMSATDTDNDKIPDDWEIATAGGLGSMGIGTYAIMSAKGPNYIMTATEWNLLAAIMSPNEANPIGLDGIPLLIKIAFGMDPVAPYQPMISGISVDADGQPRVVWASLQGTVVMTPSGARMVAANGATVTYTVEYTTDFKTWSDATASGALDNYPNGAIRYTGQPDTSARFYRVRVAFGP